MIEIIIMTLILYTPYCFLHGKISQQLSQMSYKDERLAKIYKGEWHTFGLIFRIALHLILVYLMTADLLELEALYLLIGSAGLGIVIYSPLIDLARELSPFKINATCEQWKGGFDWDCITLWFKQKLGINTKILSMIIYASFIILYFFSIME